MTGTAPIDEIEPERPYGLLAQFDGPESLTEAAQAAYAAGYRRIDGYSPFPVEELYHLVLPSRMARLALPLMALAGAIALGGGAYLLQYWTSVIDYPINVGGRPLHSWPSFIPPTVLLGILGAATGSALWMLVLNRLPKLYHPVFNDEAFARVTEDGFFLSIEADDPLYDADRTRRFLEGLKPLRLTEVPP